MDKTADKRLQRRTVQILDKEYQITCPEGEGESLRQAAYQVDKQMRDIHRSGRVIGLDRVAIMAALNLAHELILNRQGRGETEQIANLEHRLQSLQDKIDVALQGLAPTSVPKSEAVSSVEEETA